MSPQPLATWLYDFPFTWPPYHLVILSLCPHITWSTHHLAVQDDEEGRGLELLQVQQRQLQDPRGVQQVRPLQDGGAERELQVGAGLN